MAAAGAGGGEPRLPAKADSSEGERMGLGVAFRCFFRALADKAFSDQAAALLQNSAAPALAAPAPAKPPADDGAPLRLLALLQRDGRLVDFLLEDLAGVPDAQVGAAARDIHRDARAALLRYVELVPVLPQEEGETTTVPAGYDPQEIRVVGNVHGSPPHRGTVVHRGWRAAKVTLPAAGAASGSAALVVAPAEVELP